MSRYRYPDALAAYREFQPAPRVPSRWFLYALAAFGLACPFLALLVGA